MNLRNDISIINTANVKDISSELLMENGKIKLLSANEYSKFARDDFRTFCHVHARYGIPTQELVNFIKDIIGDRKAIEIGSGSGDLGHYLGIPMTDSKQQQIPHIKSYYLSVGQPVIKYPEDVEKIEALEAIYKYKPDVVIASWITPYSPSETFFGSSPYGIREDKIINMVDTFIIIGNDEIHHDKPILSYQHKRIYEPWIISRTKFPKKNCIYIWNKKNEH